jgi:D-glycero-alpha-D-manno-heptose-7-phosphate kinase
LGGGTDLQDFYGRYPGRVISTSIDKYIYLTINRAHPSYGIILKYQTTERVKDPREIVHDRFRAALLDFGIENGIEIGTFADIPAKTGLGSSSSFSVALIKGLNAHLGKSIDREEAAREASRLEIDVLKEPIGKQDQYAAAYGGFNIIQFNQDGTVEVEPVLLDHRRRSELENHLLLHFTGLTRNAADVLGVQKKIVGDKFEIYKQMSDSVYAFRDLMVAGDFKGVGAMLHEGWLRKKKLSPNMSNSLIDNMYETGLKAGAWGGKVLGAGGGGCLLFVVPPAKKAALRKAIAAFCEKNKLSEAREIPFRFTEGGANILFNSGR